MSRLKSYFIMAALGLLPLTACSSPTPTASAPSAASPAASPAAASPAATPAAATPAAAKSGEKHGVGGQVVETGDYHLEFLAAQEADGMHIDLFLQKGADHTPVENASVTAQLQLPDGTQKSLPLPYKAGDKHYGAMLEKPAPGDYQVAVQTTVNGEALKGRFSFTVK